MKGKPGSSLWLLQHELRMFWFNSGGRGGAHGKKRSWMLPLLGLGWLGLHVLAFRMLHTMPAVPAEMLPLVGLGAMALLVVVGTFMFSSGLKSSVDSLFERGDVDLLLSSPLPSRSIFTVRLGAITLGVASVYLALAAPVVNIGIFIGHADWLLGYAVILAWATICCSLAMLLTLLLVRVLGARRTRVVAQVLSAIAGALIFLLAQAHNLLHADSPGGADALAAQLARPGGAVWSAGKAATGSWLPLFCVAAAALGLFLFTVHFTHGFFVRGLQQAAGSVRARSKAATGTRAQFGRPLFDVVVRKEWRLIARDPHLLSQVLLQLLYLAPLGFVVLRNESQMAPGVAAGLTMLAASLTASLTWIIVAAEDAPDLLQASPSGAGVIRLAKLAAATMPALALMALPVLWAVAHHWTTGVLMCFTVVAATCCTALTGMWQGRPASRGAFKSRGKSNWIGSILELVGSFGWSCTAFVLIGAAGPGQSAYDARWAGISLAVALLALLLAWGTRRRTA